MTENTTNTETVELTISIKGKPEYKEFEVFLGKEEKSKVTSLYKFNPIFYCFLFALREYDQIYSGFIENTVMVAFEKIKWTHVMSPEFLDLEKF
jgi:hypothetical protein